MVWGCVSRNQSIVFEDEVLDLQLQNEHILLLQLVQLGWQLPWVMTNYSSFTIYYPILRGNVVTVTQIWVMVKKYCFHYPPASCEHLDLWMSTSGCIYFLLHVLQISHRNWTLYAHKTINTHIHFILWSIASSCSTLSNTHYTCYPQWIWGKKIDYWGNWSVSQVLTLLGVTRGNEKE